VASPGRKATILVVEDDRALRTFYQSALMIAGYHVITAEDGIEALYRLEGYRPAAVVLDLALPRLSAREVSRELLAHPYFRHIPVIVVTGTDTSDLDPAEFRCILRKPVGLDSLINAVESCLRPKSMPSKTGANESLRR
jgi:DNA-binding response OmpR family regulator